MGHRTYLWMSGTEKDDQFLFETNNSIAFYWLSLLDMPTINKTKDRWLHLHQKQQKLDEYAFLYFFEGNIKKQPNFYSFTPDYATIQQTSGAFKKFLNHYDSSLHYKLYEDFVASIQQHLNTETSQLNMDLIQLTGFSSIPDFLHQIERFVQAIADDDYHYLELQTTNDIANLTGFTSLDLDDSAFSETYRYMLENRKELIHPNSNIEPSVSTCIGAIIGTVTLAGLSYFLFSHGYWRWGVVSTIFVLVAALIDYVFIDEFFRSQKQQNKSQTT